MFASSPAVDQDQLYIGGTYIESDRGRLLACDRTGDHRWTGRVDTPEVGSSPLVADNHVDVGAHVAESGTPSAGDGGVTAFTTDGTETWTLGIEGRGVDASPALVDGTLVFGTVEGGIVAAVDS